MALNEPTKSNMDKPRSSKNISYESKSSHKNLCKHCRNLRAFDTVSQGTFEDEIILTADRLAEKELREHEKQTFKISGTARIQYSTACKSELHPNHSGKLEKSSKIESSIDFSKWQMFDVPHPFDTSRVISSPIPIGKTVNTVSVKSSNISNSSESFNQNEPSCDVRINPSKKFGISNEKELCSSKLYSKQFKIDDSISNDSSVRSSLDHDLKTQPETAKMVQKCYHGMEQMRSGSSSRRIIHSSMESLSFSKLGQPIIKDFNYAIVLGSCHQSDKRFPKEVRGRQGICMPIAAYCYSMLLHPSKWSELVLDDILEVGSKLFLDSMKMPHNHETTNELEFYELIKYCIIETKKIYFEVYEPEVVGQVRSTDKKIINIYKGLQLFFSRERAGIIRSSGLNVLAWKDRHYYFFDASGRKSDLYTCTAGRSTLAYIYDLPELSTILLKHTVLDNRPFTISKVSVVKILDKDISTGDDSSSNVTIERIQKKIQYANKSLVQTFLVWLICVYLIS